MARTKNNLAHGADVMKTLATQARHETPDAQEIFGERTSPKRFHELAGQLRKVAGLCPGKKPEATARTWDAPTIITSRTAMTRHARKSRAGSIELTHRQGEVLDTIRRFMRNNGFPPTRADIAKRVHLKHQSAVDNHLYALERKGWARVHHGIDRGICLLREGVPLYDPDDFRGVSALRSAKLEQANEPEWIDNDQVWGMFSTTPDLCLRIRGDAMDKTGLTDGGIVALARSAEGEKPKGQDMGQVQDGDVVAARVGDDVVLRRYRRIDDMRGELHPESTKRQYTIIHIDQENDFEIIGVMIGRIVASRR